MVSLENRSFAALDPYRKNAPFQVIRKKEDVANVLELSNHICDESGKYIRISGALFSKRQRDIACAALDLWKNGRIHGSDASDRRWKVV